MSKSSFNQYPTTDGTTYSQKDLDPRKINTNTINVVGFKLLAAVITKILLGCSQSIGLYISEDFNLYKNASILTCNGLNFSEGEGAWLALLRDETEFIIRLYDKDNLSTLSHICLKI